MYLYVCACRCVCVCVCAVCMCLSMCICVCVCVSPQEMSALYPDRVISVEGSVESMCRAEEQISFMLREGRKAA